MMALIGAAGVFLCLCFVKADEGRANGIMSLPAMIGGWLIGRSFNRYVDFEHWTVYLLALVVVYLMDALALVLGKTFFDLTSSHLMLIAWLVFVPAITICFLKIHNVGFWENMVDFSKDSRWTNGRGWW